MTVSVKLFVCINLYQNVYLEVMICHLTQVCTPVYEGWGDIIDVTDDDEKTLIYRNIYQFIPAVHLTHGVHS